MTYELFGAYLLRNHKELVTGFLDRVGVDHKDGMIEDMAAARPDEGKIASALAALDEKHRPEDVTLYLSLCAQHWPESARIAEQWKTIERMQKKLDALTDRFLALEEQAAPPIEPRKPPHW